MASLAFDSATGIVRIVRIMNRVIQLRSKPSNDRNLIGRGEITPRMTTST